MDNTRREVEHVPAHLSLWDAVSIILGIIIGAGIFETPDDVFRLAPGPWAALGMWVLGGLLALLGALCFAELASTYPRSGGEYVYLTRAFGPLVGYLFAWAQLTVIRTGSIGAVAYVFAKYADRLWDLGPHGILILAAASIVALTAVNILGVTLGTRTQNLLTAAKITGLVLIVIAAVVWANPQPRARPVEFGLGGWLAEIMILVLWTYSGWHEAAYVASEVRDPQRNLPRALLLGTLAVTLIYVVVNASLLIALGFAGAQAGEVPAEALALATQALGLGDAGANIMCAIVVISTLGAINGMIFTTARIYSSFAADHPLFHPLSRWSPRLGTPVLALVVQGSITVALTVGAGLWFGGSEGFDTLLYSTAAVFWIFFLLTGIAFFVLRRKDRGIHRPFTVPGYPILPLLFCGWCGAMVVGAVMEKTQLSLIGLLILLAGLPLYFISGARRPSPAAEPQASPAPQEKISVG